MTDDEFLRLATLYLEDAIDQTEQNTLHRELANSPRRVRQFNDLRLLTGLIHEHGRAWGASDENSSTSDQFSPPVAEAVVGVNGAMSFGIVLAILATAASVLFVLGWPDSRAPREETATPIATLAYTSHATWEVESRVTGDALGRGKLSLDVGLARLDFRSGATVTLQGPAEFEIVSTDTTILSSGILTAAVPQSAVGFKVVTPTMDVIDLGTAFGVSVGADGETDVCVFEGEVEVSLSESEETPQLVREGNAVRSRPKSDVIDSVHYSTARFEDGWPVTSGVLQATGLMKFVSPGPDFVPGKCEDSDHILVFPESSRVLLETDLEVNVTEPGQYIRVRRRDKQPIRAGQVVRSYLLQLNPVGELTRTEADSARVIGQITFDQPILGLIGGTTLLSRTDELLGDPLGDYSGTRRGIEPFRPEDLPDSGRDSVTLSRDRLTLSLDLSASSAVDQIRVVVSQPHPNDSED
ncbi:MAG: hypothetical protein AAFU85_23300 [Planctomycetota bacterium]